MFENYLHAFVRATQLWATGAIVFLIALSLGAFGSNMQRVQSTPDCHDAICSHRSLLAVWT